MGACSRELYPIIISFFSIRMCCHLMKFQLHMFPNHVKYECKNNQNKISEYTHIYTRHSAIQTYRQKTTCPTHLAFKCEKQLMRGSIHSCTLFRETAKWLCKSSSNTCHSWAVIQNWTQHFQLDLAIAIYEWIKNYSTNKPKAGRNTKNNQSHRRKSFVTFSTKILY